jgi:hypothetical protein
MKRHLFLLLSLSICQVNAQERLGIENSNYYPVTSIFLNPSSSVDSRTFAQLNLVGANAYALTNQAYLHKFSAWQALKGNVEPTFSTLKLKKFFYANASVDAPIGVVSYDEWGFGFFVRGRAEIDVRNVPYELTNAILLPGTVTNTKQVDINYRNVKLSEMSWVEYGINAGKIIHRDNDIMITAGGNLKYLTGINIFYANLGRLDGFMVDTFIDLEKMKGRIRVNDPGWNTGRGIGLEAGVTFKKMKDWVDSYYAHSKKSGCKYIDYKYKIGVSLLDLGYIRFNQRTLKGDIDGQATIKNYENVNSAEEVLQDNFNTSLVYLSPIWASLPTALSIQGDLNLGKNFYLNGTTMLGMTTARMTGVQRANLVSIAPRYERRQIEVAMPLTFHRFLYPQLGLAFRFRSFVLGFDNVFPLFLKKNTYGLNAYFNLAISLFKNPACREKKVKPFIRKIKEGTELFLHERKEKRKAKHEFKKEDNKKKSDLDDCPDLTAPDMMDKKDIKKETKKHRRGIFRKRSSGELK